MNLPADPVTLRTSNSSAYRGLFPLLLRDGRRDFRTGEPIEAQTFFDDKTAISARTNRQIGGKAPSKYLPAVERAAGVEPPRIGEILGSHCITAALLRTDRFWECYAARAETLLQRIEAATGKNITREPELFRAGVVAEAYDEGPEEEWDAEDPLEEAAS